MALVAAVSPERVGDRPTAVMATMALAVVATGRSQRAWAMWRGEGRYVFVDAEQWVPWTSARLQRLWNWKQTGTWVHLTDARTERSLGWIEVTPWGARRLEGSWVAALFGDCSRWSRSVLCGPFRPVVPIGRSYADLPRPYFGVAGQSLWWPRRSPPGPSPRELDVTMPTAATPGTTAT